MSDFDEVFKQNPSGVLGTTWGSVGQNGQQQQQPSSSNNWGGGGQSSSGASSRYMDDYDSFESDESDEEEEIPLQISSWGTQTATPDGTPQINVTMGGWASLIDPNVKIKPGGIGTGNLHRKGANYKPVDEQYILMQRLKNQPIPKSVTGGKKKSRSRGGKSKKSSATPPPPPSTKLSAPSRYSRPAPPSGDGSAWGFGQLASEPFWEQPAAAAQQQPVANNQWQSSEASGTMASKYAPKPPTTAPASAPPIEQQWQPEATGTMASKYAPKPSPTQSSWQVDPSGSAASKWAPAAAAATATTTPSTSQWQQQQQQQQPEASGTAASKYTPRPTTQILQTDNLPGTSASRYAPKPSLPPVSPSSSSAGSKWAPPSAKPSSTADSTYAPSNANNPPKERKILFSFNIELVPGIYAPLPVYETDNYLELVENFEKCHNLHMEQVAKQSFASKIAVLVENELRKRGISKSSAASGW